jgi:gliding motility-associated-like protein
VYPHETSGNFIAKLIVKNTDGCYDTIPHEIFISPEFTFFIPNAFSPNGDKINDYFFGSGIGIKQYDLWIFDRWGNTIYHGLQLSDKWDGKANNGSDMAQIDVYVWKVRLIDVFNKVHDYIGTVTLVK